MRFTTGFTPAICNSETPAEAPAERRRDAAAVGRKREFNGAGESKSESLDLKELVTKINAEFEVFAANAAAQVEKGNKAAGTRARKSALEISKLMKEFRKVSVEAAK